MKWYLGIELEDNFFWFSYNTDRLRKAALHARPTPHIINMQTHMLCMSNSSDRMHALLYGTHFTKLKLKPLRMFKNLLWISSNCQNSITECTMLSSHLHKIINQITYFPDPIRPRIVHCVHQQISNNNSVSVPRTNTSAYNHSIFPKSLPLWKSLLEHVLSTICQLLHFKPIAKSVHVSIGMHLYLAV